MSEEPEKVEDEPKAEALEELGDRDAIFDALWKRVEAAWDEDKPHQVLLEHALKNEQLPTLAGRYRAVKDQEPERAARAQKKIDGIVLAATQMLMATKSPAKTKTPWTWNAAAIALFAITIAYLLWALVIPHR